MKYGDWVTDAGGEIFFIREVNSHLARVGWFYCNPETKELDVKGNVTNITDIQLAEMEGYSEDEIHFLMHLAVDTNDKEWFEKLSRKRESLSVNQ